MMNAGGKKLGMKLGNYVNGHKKNHPLAVAHAAMKQMGMNNPQTGEVRSVLESLIG